MSLWSHATLILLITNKNNKYFTNVSQVLQALSPTDEQSKRQARAHRCIEQVMPQHTDNNNPGARGGRQGRADVRGALLMQERSWLVRLRTRLQCIHFCCWLGCYCLSQRKSGDHAVWQVRHGFSYLVGLWCQHLNCSIEIVTAAACRADLGVGSCSREANSGGAAKYLLAPQGLALSCISGDPAQHVIEECVGC